MKIVKIIAGRVEIPISIPIPPTRRDWGPRMKELAGQLKDGRVYDRDLVALATALNTVLDAYSRRPYVRDRNRDGGFSYLR